MPLALSNMSCLPNILLLSFFSLMECPIVESVLCHDFGSICLSKPYSQVTLNSHLACTMQALLFVKGFLKHFITLIEHN